MAEINALVTALTNALQSFKTDTVAIDCFKEDTESVSNYLQRLENNFSLRGLTGGDVQTTKHKVQLLLNFIGPKYFKLLSDLCSPDLPNDQTYDQLKSLLINHLDKPANEVMEQNKFLNRIQKETESISEFVAELKFLANRCNFKCTHCKKTTMATHLRSQFIRGIRDAEIRVKLLQQSTLTFEKTIETALAMEAAKNESSVIQSANFQNTAGANRLDRHQDSKRYPHNNSSSHGNRKFPRTNRNAFQRKNERRSSNDPLHGVCYRCGDSRHRADSCKHAESTCDHCGKKGHIRPVCRQKLQSDSPRQSTNRNKRPFYKRNIPQHNALNTTTSPNADSSNQSSNQVEPSVNYFDMCTLNSSDMRDKIIMNVSIEGKNTLLELDSGAAVTTMSLKKIKNIVSNIQLKPTDVKLRTYTEEIIAPMGIAEVTATCNGITSRADIYVMKEDYASMLGREWIRRFQIFPEILNVSVEETPQNKLKALISEFSDLFKDEIGKVPNYEYSLPVKSDMPPAYFKPRILPYAIRPLVEAELNNLEGQGVISKIDHPSWGTPIVPVVKGNKVRICGDYKVTLNKVLKDDKYPLPRIRDILAKLEGGKFFCTLDVHKAYMNLSVDYKSAELQTISTHKGTYAVHRLMFGIKVAPQVWQRFIDQLLGDIEGVSCFFDDIKIQGSDITQLETRLRLVFERLRQSCLHLNKNKCQFLQKTIKYLGFEIDAHGIHQTQEMVNTILKANPPTNVSELRSYLGLVGYYHMFIPNLSSIVEPLNRLSRKGVPFTWSQSCQNAFDWLKREIASKRVLTPYNPNLPIILATDASPYGIGACLSHELLTGEEKPVAFCSRTLTQTERNYSQLDKEATAIYWAVKKFFVYLFGIKFILITDHKPLTTILHPSKNLPEMSAARLLRYAQFLSNFNYEIRYRDTTKHSNADFASRFPLKTNDPIDVNYITICNLEQIKVLPVKYEDIVRETPNDPELKAVYNALQTGSTLTNTIFDGKDGEFSLENGCIFRGVRVVIPSKLRTQILNELHNAHIGMSKMKNLARQYCYWRRIDKDIETMVKECASCQEFRNNPPKFTSHPWYYPEQPWCRIHLDFAGPFMGHYFFLIVDAHSKWVEIFIMSSITTSLTIQNLRETFARFGLPNHIVSDNGPQFRSEEFQEFLRINGIGHKFSAPYHPATNGQVERYVQELKKGLKKMTFDGGNLRANLTNYLQMQHKTAHSLTGSSPAELMLKVNFKTRLDLLKRNSNSVRTAQSKNAKPIPRVFSTNQPVNFRMYGPNQKWNSGEIVNVEGPLNYEIQDTYGNLHRRHVDQLISKPQQPTKVMVEQSQPETAKEVTPTSPKIIKNQPILRRSERTRRAPVKLDL